MRYSATLVLAAATVSLAQSTSDIPSYKSALDIEISPDSVDENQRWSWCNAQYNTCRTLCEDDTEANDCEQSDLSYECKCASNGTAPGLEYYTQTMPTFICKAAYEQCIVNHTTQKDHDLCEKNIDDKCSTLDPPSPKKGSKKDDEDEDDNDDDDEESSTTSSAASTTSSESSTDTADNSEVTTTESDDFAAPTMVPRGAAAIAAMGVLAYLG